MGPEVGKKKKAGEGAIVGEKRKSWVHLDTIAPSRSFRLDPLSSARAGARHRERAARLGGEWREEEAPAKKREAERGAFLIATIGAPPELQRGGQQSPRKLFLASFFPRGRRKRTRRRAPSGTERVFAVESAGTASPNSRGSSEENNGSAAAAAKSKGAQLRRLSWRAAASFLTLRPAERSTWLSMAGGVDRAKRKKGQTARAARFLSLFSFFFFFFYFVRRQSFFFPLSSSASSPKKSFFFQPTSYHSSLSSFSPTDNCCNDRRRRSGSARRGRCSSLSAKRRPSTR